MPIFNYKYMIYSENREWGDNMNLKKISFGNFKSLYNTSFEPGKVNVFIGAYDQK